MAHENATPRPWTVERNTYGVTVRRPSDYGSTPICEIWANGDDRESNAALIVEAVNAYDTLRAENERLKADRLALYVWMRHVDWSECDLSEWLNNKPTALCIPDGNDGHAAAAKLYRELGGEDGFDYAKLRALSEAQP